MKNIFIVLAASAISFAACNSSSSKNDSKEKSAEQSTVIPEDKSKSEKLSPVSDDTEKKGIKAIVGTYLKLKNALTKDMGKDAATAANDLGKDFTASDKSALTPEQQKIYDDIKDDAKEHADHIGSNGGNIKHQREHFDMLSKDIYELVKTFGAGQKLYYEHCPMYNDRKGANWLSESKVISNPYYGKVMLTCGTVKEELQ